MKGEQTVYIPCHKYCPDRAVGCHSDCEEYKEYKRLLAEQKAQKSKGNAIEGYVRQNHNKMKAIARKRRYGC